MNREVLTSDTLCSNAKYNAIQPTPWAPFDKSVKGMAIAADTSRLASINLNYWSDGCNALASVSGMANLRDVPHRPRGASRLPHHRIAVWDA